MIIPHSSVRHCEGHFPVSCDDLTFRLSHKGTTALTKKEKLDVEAIAFHYSHTAFISLCLLSCLSLLSLLLVL